MEERKKSVAPTRKSIYIDEILKECKNNELEYDKKETMKFLNYLQLATLKEIHKDLKIFKGQSKYKEE